MIPKGSTLSTMSMQETKYVLKCGHEFDREFLKDHLRKELFCPECDTFISQDESYLNDGIISAEAYQRLKSLHMQRDLIKTMGFLFSMVEPGLKSNLIIDKVMVGAYDRKIAKMTTQYSRKDQDPAIALMGTLVSDAIASKSL
jgi:hypothetical protein